MVLLFGCQQKNATICTEMDLNLLRADSLDEAGYYSGKDLIRLYDSLIIQCNQYGCLTGKADILRRYGNLYMKLGLLDAAMEKELQSLQISEHNKDTFAYWSTFSNIGTIYSYFKLPEKALLYYIPAFNYYNGIHQQIAVSGISRNIADAFAVKGDTEKAGQYAQIAMKEKMKIPDEYAAYKADSLESLLSLCSLSPQSDSLITVAERWCLAEKNENRKVSAFAYFAQHHAKKKQFSRAQLWKDSTLFYLSKVKLNGVQEEVFQQLSNYYSAIGDTQNWFVYAGKLAALKDSGLSLEKLKTVSNAEGFYQLLNHKENSLLRSENRKKYYGIVALALGLLAALLLLLLYRYRQIQKQKEAAQLLKDKNNEITELLQRQELETFDAALRGQEEERTRIAQELHDRLGSLLSIAKLNFSTLQADIRQLETRHMAHYGQVNDMLSEAMDEVRRISHDLYAGSVVNFGLVTAMYQMTAAVAAANQIQVLFQHRNVPPSLSHAVQIELYRVTQELLQNSLKYASASRIDISLMAEGELLRLSYEDDGLGFDTSNDQFRQGLGYRNIATRIARIGGKWEVEARPGSGMLFWAEVTMPTGPLTTDKPANPNTTPS